MKINLNILKKITANRGTIKRKQKSGTTKGQWTDLTPFKSINDIIEESKEKDIIIFKHSTQCNISAMALSRLSRTWDHKDMEKTKMYVLDLIRHRDVSNQISSTFNVRHESPQLLLIREGKSIYNNSHLGILYADLKKIINTSRN